MNISGEPSKTQTERQKKIQSASRALDASTNPCIEEHEQALKCLNQNDFDHEKCQYHFANYKSCKKFWVGFHKYRTYMHLASIFYFFQTHVVAERKAKGITPYLPAPEDREKIRQEQMNSMVSDYYSSK